MIVTPLSDSRSCGIYKKSRRLVEYTVSRYPARTYGERIRRRRLELGLSQVVLAKLLGVSEMSVVGWEKGWHEPCRECREKLGKILGISCDVNGGQKVYCMADNQLDKNNDRTNLGSGIISGNGPDR